MLSFAILIIYPAFAQSAQTLPTDQGTLNIGFSTDPSKVNPGDTAKMQIDFINPKTNEIQVHIDYKVKVTREGENIFEIPRQHTGSGSVTIPVEFADAGKYSVWIGVDGILFQPIPLETTTFEVSVGESQMDNKQSEVTVSIPEGNVNPGCERTNECYIPYEVKIKAGDKVTWKNNDVVLHTVTSGQEVGVPDDKFDGSLPPGETFTFTFDTVGKYPYFCSLHPWMEGIVIVEEASAIEQPPSDNGGCLIATATYGTELAPQVQLLREIRDNALLQTSTGTAFMTGFNQFYYSFSPTIADWERQNPIFKEAVKVAITPLITSLSLLQYADIDSDFEVLGYGISIILMNIGMYFVLPAIAIIKLSHRKNVFCG